MEWKRNSRVLADDGGRDLCCSLAALCTVGTVGDRENNDKLKMLIRC